MFEIFTDSPSNLSDKLIKKYNVHIVSLTCYVGDEEFLCYDPHRKFDDKRFCEALKSKQKVTTSMANEATFTDAFEQYAKEGKDILYIGFSSGFSGTFNAGKAALDALKEKYPERNLIAIDSLTGAYGEGLAVIYAAEMRSDGLDITQTAARIKNLIPHLRSHFIVEDLFFLKRGGRISASTALAGTLLGIRPLLKSDDTGHIVMYSKVRGRKQAVNTLIDELKRSVDVTKKQIIAITQAYCPDDAKYLESELRKLPYISDVLVGPQEPVTLAHCGPGTLALFYISKSR